MNTFCPQGHRFFHDVRDEIGAEAMLADLAAGKLIAVTWGSDGSLHDVFPNHWLSSQADYTIRNARFYSKYPTQGKLLVRKPEPKPATKVRPAKNKGGHPGKWDWAGAAGFASGYIVENDYPSTQGEMEKLIANWFITTAGECPDDRQIERFVSALYRRGKT